MTILSIVQIVLSILLIITILLQRSEAGLGGAFGGGGMDSNVHHTRRGSEKLIFQATIVLAIFFAATAIVALLLA